MAAPFSSLQEMNAAFGRDPVAAKKKADAAKGKHQPVYTGESKASTMAATPGHPGKHTAAAKRKVKKKSAGKSNPFDKNAADDTAGAKDNPMDDPNAPAAKSSGAMNSGFKAFLEKQKGK